MRQRTLDDSLAIIASACERLRRLPESRWARPPAPPLGARDPSRAPSDAGQSLDVQVRDAITLLMEFDAERRGVTPFKIDVGCFALPDALLATARSVHQDADAAAQQLLHEVADRAQAW